MAEQGGLSGYQPYPLAIRGPQGSPLALAPYGPQHAELSSSSNGPQGAVPQGLSAAAEMDITPIGTAGETREIVLTAEQDGRILTQTHRVTRAVVSQDMQNAEDRCRMLREEIRTIVRIAND